MAQADVPEDGMIPLFLRQVPGDLLTASEAEDADGYGVVLAWTRAASISVQVSPLGSTYAHTEQGDEVQSSVRLIWSYPPGRSVAIEDRVRTEAATYRLTSVRRYGDVVEAEGVEV